eukprot:TRINITY_DN21125_c0_g1_i1.p1 TRINITY_DN21125_c0_g1~~TRINITY_DN21125_c0_g1_i1.p1  ORF type:complete len:101 (+),score=14.97 TRINITY_DN21125_c0_g1_i1:164-466(+)
MCYSWTCNSQTRKNGIEANMTSFFQNILNWLVVRYPKKRNASPEEVNKIAVAKDAIDELASQEVKLLLMTIEAAAWKAMVQSRIYFDTCLLYTSPSPRDS